MTAEELANINPNDLPGVQEAMLNEQQLRSEAFIIGLVEFICGIEVLPLNFAHLNNLALAGSPFVVAGTGAPGPADIGTFLWAVSQDYIFWIRFRNKWAPVYPRIAEWVFKRKHRQFAKRIARKNPKELLAGVIRYLDRAFQDAPGRGGAGFVIPYFSGQAAFIHMLATEYGWEEEQILTCPVRRIYQFVRVITKRNNPNATFFNPSDRVRTQEFEKLKAQIKKDDGHE